MGDKDLPKTATDNYIPPPKDPYARLQTPYEKRSTPEDDRNPFIEFRRLADKAAAQISSVFPRVLGFDQYYKDKLAEQNSFEHDLLKTLKEAEAAVESATENFQKEIGPKMLGGWPATPWCDARGDNSGLADVAAAPKGWKIKMDPWGRTWYKNKTTGQMTQTHPEPDDAEPVQFERDTYHDTSGPDAICPAGWEVATTASGQKFYVNSETGRATKNVPSPLILPPGWESVFDVEKQDRSQRAESSNKEASSIKPWTDEDTLELSKLMQDSVMPKSQTLSSIFQAADNAETWRNAALNCPGMPDAMREHAQKDSEWYGPMPGFSYEDGAIKQPNLSSPVSQSRSRSRRREPQYFYPGDADTETDLYDHVDSFKTAEQASNSTVSNPVKPEPAQRSQGLLSQWLGLGHDGRKKEQHNKNLEEVKKSFQPAHDTSDEFWDDVQHTRAFGDLLDLIASIPFMFGDAQGEASPIDTPDTVATQKPLQRPPPVPEKPSVVMQLTNVTSRTLPDGSTEVRRELKKRFSDGKEETEQSTDIIPVAKSDKQNGWFWN